MYEIGEKVWFKGDECEIVGKPYSLYGGMWQDAEKDNGDIISVPTKEETEKRILQGQKEWKEQQAGFRRLHKTMKEETK